MAAAGGGKHGGDAFARREPATVRSMPKGRRWLCRRVRANGEKIEAGRTAGGAIDAAGETARRRPRWGRYAAGICATTSSAKAVECGRVDDVAHHGCARQRMSVSQRKPSRARRRRRCQTCSVPSAAMAAARPTSGQAGPSWRRAITRRSKRWTKAPRKARTDPSAQQQHGDHGEQERRIGLRLGPPPLHYRLDK